jgi:hypothetical protein
MVGVLLFVQLPVYGDVNLLDRMPALGALLARLSAVGNPGIRVVRIPTQLRHSIRLEIHGAPPVPGFTATVERALRVV